MAETTKSDRDEAQAPDAKGSLASNAVKLALFGAVLYFFVWPLIQEFPQAWQSIRNLDPWLGALAVVVDGLSWLAYAYMLQILISRPARPSLALAFGTVVASRGLSRVVPVGAAGTVAVEYKLLHQRGASDDELAYAISAQAVVSALVLNVMAVSALVVAVSTTGYSFEFVTAGVFALLVVIGISLAVTVLVRYTDETARFVAKALGLIPHVDGSRGAALITRVGDKVNDLLDDRQRLIRLFVSSMLNWFLGAVSVWITLLALGQSSRFLGVLVAFAVANVLALLPISPGGIGIYEAAMTASLGIFGVPRALAVAGTVTFRLIDFWLPIPLGALCYAWVDRVTSKSAAGAGRDES